MVTVLEGMKTTGESFSREFENNVEELTLVYIELLSKLISSEIILVLEFDLN